MLGQDRVQAMKNRLGGFLSEVLMKKKMKDLMMVVDVLN